MSLLLFAGDSVTDCGRTFFDAEVAAGHLGDGWVRVVAAQLGHRRPGEDRVLNAGVAGDRVADLAARWDHDVERFAPQVLTILIGVNDVLLEPRTPLADFEAAYLDLLVRVPQSVERLVVAEPFVLPVDAPARALHEALRPYVQVVRRLVSDVDGALALPLDDLFDDACRRAEPRWWAGDGVHPTAAGHGLIAEAWLRSGLDLPG